MKLKSKTKCIIFPALVALFGGLTFLIMSNIEKNTFAKGESSDRIFVAIYDEEEYVTVKTYSDTVENILEKLKIKINDTDETIPGRDAKVEENSTIRIIHSHPIILLDGKMKRIFETTKTEIEDVMSSIGYQITNCEQVSIVMNPYFLETGIVTAYEVTPKDGCITLEINGIKLAAKWVGETERKTLNSIMGRNRYLVTKVDGSIVERQETYYDLDMSGVMSLAKNWEGCSHSGSYSVREDGVKVDDEGYILVAADLNLYARCSVVDTSLGLGKVYDTGSFALVNNEQFDIATDWTNRNGY